MLTAFCLLGKRKWPYLPGKRKKVHRKGSKWQNKDTGAFRYQGHRQKGCLDEERKVQKKEGWSDTELWGEQGGATEAKGGQTPQFTSNWRPETFLRTRGIWSAFRPLQVQWYGFRSLLPLSELRIHSVTWKRILYFNPKLTAFADI